MHVLDIILINYIYYRWMHSPKNMNWMTHYQHLIVFILSSQNLVSSFPCTTSHEHHRKINTYSKTLKKPSTELHESINESNNNNNNNEIALSSRRGVLNSVLAGTALAFFPVISNNGIAFAEDEIKVTPVNMILYDDPTGLFRIRIPKEYFILRRSAQNKKGGGPRGQSRKGSSIFTSGDIGKAEIVSVERFSAVSFLQDEGVTEVKGDLSTFPAIGTADAIAKFLILRRSREAATPIQPKVAPKAIVVSKDGKTLSFEYITKIDVQKPELLMEQMGVDELYRTTLVRMELHSNDGNIMVSYASALQTEFNGPDGVMLRDTIDSFQVLPQEVNSQEVSL